MTKTLTLNKTPIRTSNNYGINDLKLDVNFNNTKFNNTIDILTDEYEKLEIKIDKEYTNVFDTKIGLSFEKFYKIKIIVKENEKIEKNIYIKNVINENSDFICEMNFIFEKNSKANFVIENRTNDYNNKVFNYIKQVNYLKENAVGKITFCNLLNDNSQNFIAIENEVEEEAKLDYNFIDLGGKTKVSNYYTILKGNESKNIFNNIYIGNEENVIDMNYHVEIKGKKSICKINAQGAITDKAIKNFKGTIDFIKDSKKSIGEENENCLILSNMAKSKSLPMLLCHEEDVQGAHGVSSGRIDEDKLFYIMSKGITKKDAEKLIVMANFNSILQEIDDKNLQNEIIEKIERKI